MSANEKTQSDFNDIVSIDLQTEKFADELIDRKVAILTHSHLSIELKRGTFQCRRTGRLMTGTVSLTEVK
jgi:hypothetical protein